VDEHPNLALIRRIFDAFGGGDKRPLVDGIADDAVWTVVGAAPVSRVYRGRDEIYELFRETRRRTAGTYFSELRWALADDERGVAVYRASGRRPDGRELAVDQVLLIDYRDGRWQQIVAVPTDPVAFEAFWA
jgi:ketosteroid isomerase-like protein